MTAIEGQKQTEGTKNPPPAPQPGNGLNVNSQMWETEGRFIGFQEPRDWEIEGRSGTTYRIDLRIAEGTMFVKLDGQLFDEMQKANLQFGDKVVLYWGKTSVKGELRVQPVSWKKA